MDSVQFFDDYAEAKLTTQSIFDFAKKAKATYNISEEKYIWLSSAGGFDRADYYIHDGADGKIVFTGICGIIMEGAGLTASAPDSESIIDKIRIYFKYAAKQIYHCEDGALLILKRNHHHINYVVSGWPKVVVADVKMINAVILALGLTGEDLRKYVVKNYK